MSEQRSNSRGSYTDERCVHIFIDRAKSHAHNKSKVIISRALEILGLDNLNIFLIVIMNA